MEFQVTARRQLQYEHERFEGHIIFVYLKTKWVEILESAEKTIV